MANYQIRNPKPGTYQAELFIVANNSWMVLGSFSTLEEAVSFVKASTDAETFKERIYDSVGRLISTTTQPVDNA